MPTKVILSTTEQKEIIEKFHKIGHFGIQGVYKSIRQTYWWPSMYPTIKTQLAECLTCNMFRRPKKLEYITVSRETRIFGKIALDFVGPLPITEDGNRYILVAVDYHSRWPWAIATPDCSSHTVLKFLLDIISSTCIPDIILTDQGTHFTSELLQHLQKSLVSNILKQHHITHAQTA